MNDVASKVATLMEAMPYLKKYAGKVIVIKYGGNAMINEELKAAGAGEGDTQRAIQESIGVIFGKILGNAGVYKDTEEGREAFRRFCKSL